MKLLQWGSLLLGASRALAADADANASDADGFVDAVGVLDHVPFAHLPAFENLNVLQTVDLGSAYLTQTFDMHVANTGEFDADFYLFLVPEARASSLARMEAMSADSNVELSVGPSELSIPGYAVFSVTLEEPLPPRGKTQFGVLLVFSEPPAPLPASAKQDAQQMLAYRGTSNYVSLYRTYSQETQFKTLLNTAEVLNIAEGTTEVLHSDDTGYIVFGPYERLGRLEELDLVLRFENPVPLARVQRLERTAWISHWGGTVSVDASLDMQNVGTVLKGEFSRLDFTNARVTRSLNTAAVRGFRIPLPEGHREEYYVDLVGNVSTSLVMPGTLELMPRYPIMGGWFYNFTVGWAADLGKFVHQASPTTYLLSLSLVDGPEGVGYGEVTNRVVLPEGAEVLDIVSEVEPLAVSKSKTYSYLDLYGRETVELEFKNLVSEQSGLPIYISYRYSPLMALRKPVSYAVLIFVLLASLHVTVKLF